MVDDRVSKEKSAVQGISAEANNAIKEIRCKLENCIDLNEDGSGYRSKLMDVIRGETASPGVPKPAPDPSDRPAPKR
jgi:hypothetical protein